MAIAASTFSRLKEVLDAGRDATAATDAPVRLAVELVGGAPADTVAALKAALVPETPRGMVHVGRLVHGAPVVVNPEADACVIVCGDDAPLAAGAARGWAKAGVPVCLVGRGASAVPEVGLAGGAPVGSVPAGDARQAVKGLGGWLSRATDKPWAVAANFPFCRRPLAEEEVLSCAAANAGVGAVEFVKGADFPVMCATESSMVMRIASMYGAPTGAARAPELLLVVLGGMAMRAVARRGSRLLPKGAWAVKGGVGWLGTWLTGQAVIWRFEEAEEFDRRASWVRDRVREAARATVDRAAALTGAIVEVEPGALYTEPGTRSVVPVDVVDVVQAPSGRSWFEVGGTAGTGR